MTEPAVAPANSDSIKTATTTAITAPSIAVIVNANAGTGHAQELAQRIIDNFAQHGLTAAVTLAADGQQLIDGARAALKAGTDIIVAGGGDGSINAVAGVVTGSQAALGVLPLGTLNHFAKDLNIPLTLAAAIANIAHGRRLAVDTAEVNGARFINNSSLGLYPDIVRDREKQQSRLGRGKWLAFCWAALEALRRYPFLNVHLQVKDGEHPDNDSQHRRRTPFVFIGNNDYQMDGLNIGSRQSLNQGRLSLYVCHSTGRLGLLRLALHALFGRLQQARDFDILQATEIEIETRHRRARRLRVATDGEVNIMQTPLSYRIHPASLIVMVPQPVPAENAPVQAATTAGNGAEV